MKTLFLIVFTFFIVERGVTQDAIAKIKFEQAEEAYTKNDFTTTLFQLDEAQKILGATNPKILYLRIMAQAKLIDDDSALLPELKRNCSFYLKNYAENANLEDKYKEVYLVSENLMQYEPNQDFLTGLQLFQEKKYEEALPFINERVCSCLYATRPYV
jgi:uncharacterized protein